MINSKWNTLILPKVSVDKNGWHCLKCWEEDELVDLKLKEQDFNSFVEYWVCPECDTEYQVDIEIERDFLTMVEVSNE